MSDQMIIDDLVCKRHTFTPRQLLKVRYYYWQTAQGHPWRMRVPFWLWRAGRAVGRRRRAR